jgi:hypothetical protein
MHNPKGLPGGKAPNNQIRWTTPLNVPLGFRDYHLFAGFTRW